MAFNPFNAFRRNKKVLLAGVTILAMITFIFSFGAGDLFQRGLHAIGQWRGRGVFVAKVYGRNLYESDLDRLGRNRQIANDFLTSAASLAAQTTIQDALTQFNAAKPDARDPILERVLRNWQTRQFFAAQPMVEQVEQIRQDLSTLRLMKQLKPEQASLLSQLEAALTFDYWLRNPERPRGSYLFGGGKRPEELVDFAIWKHQANELGIRLTPADVRREINQLVGRPDFFIPNISFKDDDRARGIFRAYRDLSEDELNTALADEFRVLLAQEALWGEPGADRGPVEPLEAVDRSPAMFTPLEFLEFFRRQRTTLRVAFLDLPVASFESKVKGEPSDAEIDRLYERYKEVEPNPESPLPGFKEPRRVRLEFLIARPESPFYQAQAKLRTLAPEIGIVLGFANSYGIGGGPAAWAGVAGTVLAQEDPTLKEYDFYKDSYRSWIEPARTPGASEFHENSYQNPATLASLIAQVGASAGTFSPLAAAPTAYIGTAYVLETRDRLRVIPTTVLAGGNLHPLSGMTFPLPVTPRVPTLAESMPQVLDRVLKSQAPRAVDENMRKFSDEVTKLKSKPEEVKAYIAKAVKEMSFEHHVADKAVTRQALREDKSVAKLREAFVKANRQNSRAAEFADAIFNLQGTYSPGRFDLRDESSPFGPPTESYFVWLNEDLPARVRPLEAIRPEVVAAWRQEAARLLAKREAERIQAEITKRNAPADAEKFLRETKAGEVFELNGIALMIPSGGVGNKYQPYRPPVDRIAFPRVNFVEQLMTMKKPGDATVVRDRPEANYYVAVLLDRAEPKHDREFADVFERTALRDSQLQQILLFEQRNQFRRDVMRQMRVESGATDKEGRYHLPENLIVRTTSEQDE